MRAQKSREICSIFVILVSFCYFTFLIPPSFLQSASPPVTEGYTSENVFVNPTVHDLYSKPIQVIRPYRSVFFDQIENRSETHRAISSTARGFDTIKHKVISTTQITDDPIFIDGNNDFVVFPGTGTVNDPFKIENFTIVGSDTDLITIVNTNVYFEIVNNFLNGSGKIINCIYFFNVSHGTIENNIISDSVDRGILLENSSNNIIINNSVINHGEGGILLLFSSDNNQIINNSICENNGNGIMISFSQDNLIISNLVFRNQWNGIHLEDPANGNTIKNNNVSSNFNDGIFLEGTEQRLGSSENNLVNNFVSNNSKFGIFVVGSYNKITGNNISFNEEAILISSSDNSLGHNNRIEENFCHDNKKIGIHFIRSDNNIISNNYLFNIFRTGMYFRHGTNNSVVNNTITETSYLSKEPYTEGIVVHMEGNMKIYNNTITDIDRGITPYLSDNNIISHNTVINAEQGIKLETCINNSVIKNQIYIVGEKYGFLYGIMSDTGSANNYLLNNTLSNLLVPIYLAQSSLNLISYNELVDNNRGIFIVENSNFNMLTHNKISNSGSYGVWIEVGTANNSIKFNDFFDNNENGSSGAIQALDSGYKNIFMFNHWNDWTSPDANSDGFTDNPYYIDESQNNFDLYPLVYPNPPISHLILPPMILSPKGGETFSSSIIIQWDGSPDSFDHPILYSVYLSKQNGESWSLIASNITETTFKWNITSSEYNSKNCLIKIVASCCMQNVEDISDGSFTIYNASKITDESLIRLIILSILAIGLFTVIIAYNLRLKANQPFIEYFQSNQIDFLRAIYHKVVVGLENITTGVIPESTIPPLIRPQERIEPLTQLEKKSLIPYFPLEIQEILKSIKGKTALVLIEMAYQEIRETNPSKLSQNLNIPPATISSEIKTLTNLGFIESYIDPSVIEDARFRYYNITTKGFSFLYSLKGALEISIDKLKLKVQNIPT